MPTTTSPPQRGDESTLYRQLHRHLIGSVTLAVGADRAHVEDACQFAWTQLLAYQPDRDRIFAWLRTTAIREVWRTTGKERRDHLHTLRTPDPGTTNDNALAGRAALQLLAGLRPHERRYLTLQALGLTRTEIATTCHTTTRHVDRHLTRGRHRARLRRQ